MKNDNILLLSPKEWRDRARAGAEMDECGLVKEFIPEIKQGEEGDRLLTFTISTEDVDRDGDIIQANGWDLGNYLKNPVVLWAHNHWSPPIAKSIDIKIDAGKLVSTAEFTPEELNPFGFMIYNMYTGGFLSAVSVGFRSQEWSFDEDRHGINFIEQELLEYSSVPVPANQNALVQARSAGIDLSPMKTWCERYLDEYHEESGLWLPKSSVEEMLKVVGSNVSIKLTLDESDDDTAKDDAVSKELEIIAVDLELDDEQREKFLEAVKDVSFIRCEGKEDDSADDAAAADAVAEVDDGGAAETDDAAADDDTAAQDDEAALGAAEEKAKAASTFFTSVSKCARCGEDHEEVEFNELGSPIGEHTHYAFCPKTLEPIVLRIVVGADDDKDIKAPTFIETLDVIDELLAEVNEKIVDEDSVKVTTENLHEFLSIDEDEEKDDDAVAEKDDEDLESKGGDEEEIEIDMSEDEVRSAFDEAFGDIKGTIDEKTRDAVTRLTGRLD